MKDSYGDGMCCSYGSGSYSLDDSSGNLASGGSFGSSETTNFCVGGGTPAEICDDGVDIDRDTLVDCANTEDCASAPNCQPADWTELGNDDFEGGWGTWNDGGSDARRSARDSAFAPQGYLLRPSSRQYQHLGDHLGRARPQQLQRSRDRVLASPREHGQCE